MKLDIKKNRKSQKWTKKQLIGRFLWAFIQPAFRFSPRQWWWWRRSLLRTFGAKIGVGAHIYPSVKIAVPWNVRIGNEASVGDCARLYSLGEITVGARATVSQFAHICAGSHETASETMDLLKTPIAIGEDAWVCADAFLGPGVEIGSKAIVGARAVVTKSVEQGVVVAGNPAEIIRRRVED